LTELFTTDKTVERALLVHQRARGRVTADDFEELHGLAVSAGADVVGRIGATRSHPDAGLFVGSGKAQEIARTVEAERVDLVIFNQTISPIQERNLETAVKCRVVDRTRLILDIFALRARTHEGKLQVELAQLRHLSTRLVRGWTHLERQRGGIGLRGPGETQLETDRRLLSQRIRHLQGRLEKVRSQRDVRRQRRTRARVPTIAIVGYTNAGKSSLFNRLVGENVFAADQLFATLDPTMRRLEVPGFGPVILSDTVGFISGLPHSLVEAFMSTLEEVAQADLLLRVADDSDPDVREREAHVGTVLSEIHAAEIPSLRVRNKTDLSGRTPGLIRDALDTVRTVRVSATTGDGIEALLEELSLTLIRASREVALHVPPEAGRLRAFVFDVCHVLDESHDSDGVFTLHIRADTATIGRIERHPDFQPGFWFNNRDGESGSQDREGWLNEKPLVDVINSRARSEEAVGTASPAINSIKR